MTPKQLREYKRANQERREAILRASYKKPQGDNLCIYLGGVIQRGKYAGK